VEQQIKSKARVTNFGKVYTARRQVVKMVDLVSEQVKSITSTVLEPACGNGNFLSEILSRKAVYHFKRYEDASLEYTGINKHAEDENVGLFSTIITREEYEHMDELQNASMAAKARRAEAKESKAVNKVAQSSQKPRVTPPKANYSDVRSAPVAITAKPTPTAPKPVRSVENTAQSTPIVDASIVKAGLKVVHCRFGKGVVIARTKENAAGKYTITVRFDNGGEKTLEAPLIFEKRFVTVGEE